MHIMDSRTQTTQTSRTTKGQRGKESIGLYKCQKRHHKECNEKDNYGNKTINSSELSV